ncbi:MAG: hypothetical protein B7Z55_17860, partial [Planctomycetales bacterium 12-60-4]
DTLPRVLCVDDEPNLLAAMERTLHGRFDVVTANGGTAGLVTMEDILEEIVGEIEDEYDEDIIRQRISAVTDAIAEVDGRVHLDDLNERFEYDLPEDQEFDTIGGFVFSLAGRVPVVGETIRLKHLLFTVLAADRRRVTRLRVEVSPQSSDAIADAI